MVAPYRILYTHAPSAGKPALLFGTGVSAKNFKKATDRNRVKRLIKETWRLQKTSLKDKVTEKGVQLNVFFIYTGKELPAFADLYKKTGIALGKLEKILAL